MYVLFDLAIYLKLVSSKHAQLLYIFTILHISNFKCPGLHKCGPNL